MQQQQPQEHYIGDTRTASTKPDETQKRRLLLQTSRESQQFHRARTIKLSADSLPKQRVHEHATLYLAADALGHWKQVAADASTKRIRAIKEEIMKKKRRLMMQQLQQQRQQQLHLQQQLEMNLGHNKTSTPQPSPPSQPSLPAAPSASSNPTTANNSSNNNSAPTKATAAAPTPTIDEDKRVRQLQKNLEAPTVSRKDDDDFMKNNIGKTDHNSNHQQQQQGNNNNNSDVHSGTHYYNQSFGNSNVNNNNITADYTYNNNNNNNTTTRNPSIVESSRPSDRVLVINVGGTLGMWPDPSDGRLRPKKGFLLDQMLNLHELRFPEVPVFDFIEYHELVDSSDVNSETWETLARDIYEHYDDYSGILVAHGTDTLHYTAAALSFALEKLAKPVIVMGSMIPLCELYTDTRRNVTAALRFAGCGQWLKPGVYVFFHEQLFYGTRCVKMNDSLKAFESPNSPSAADLNTLRFIRSASSAATFLATNNNNGTTNANTIQNPATAAQVQGDNTYNTVPNMMNNNNGNNGMSAVAEDPSLQIYSDSFYATLAATSNVTIPLNLRAKFSDRVLCLGIVPDFVLSEASKLFTAQNHSKYRNNITLPRAIILKVPEMNIQGSAAGMAASLQQFGAAAAASGCAVFATSSSSLHGLSPSTTACLLKFVPDVVPLNDMLAEVAVVKAMWLLGEMLGNSVLGGYQYSSGSSSSMGGMMRRSGGGGNFSDNNSLENFKRLMFVNLRGEVTETSKSIPRPVWLSKL